MMRAERIMSPMSTSDGLTICPHCNEPLPRPSATCPFCAEPLTAVVPDSTKLETPPDSPESKPSAEMGRASAGKWRRRFRAAGLLLMLLLVAIVFVYFFVFLQENRYWPFATGTSNPAFLGTTFGMSSQEVRRTLQKHGTQLLNYDEYKRVEQTPLIDLFDWLPLYSEDRNQYLELFMPSIDIFDSRTEAQFTFRSGRLESVSVHFGSYGITNALAVVESVKAHLSGAYQFTGREDSDYVPGAYTLKYRSTNTSASLWVNLPLQKGQRVNSKAGGYEVLEPESKNADPKKQYIILTIFDSKSQAERKQQLKEREQKAFGTGK